jgi:hypothetical protein
MNLSFSPPKMDVWEYIDVYHKDLSIWVLLFSNVLTIFLSILEKWSVATVLYTFVLQSFIIGFFTFLKILDLRHFSTEGLKIDEVDIIPTEDNKKRVAFLFLWTYNGTFFAYVVFLLLSTAGASIVQILQGGVIFFVNHLFSYLFNRNTDRNRIMRISDILGTSFGRAIPMHVITFLFSLVPTNLMLVVFLSLKTLVDLVSHTHEHFSRNFTVTDPTFTNSEQI